MGIGRHGRVGRAAGGGRGGRHEHGHGHGHRGHGPEEPRWTAMDSSFAGNVDNLRRLYFFFCSLLPHSYTSSVPSPAFLFLVSGPVSSLAYAVDTPSARCPPARSSRADGSECRAARAGRRVLIFAECPYISHITHPIFRIHTLFFLFLSVGGARASNLTSFNQSHVIASCFSLSFFFLLSLAPAVCGFPVYGRPSLRRMVSRRRAVSSLSLACLWRSAPSRRLHRLLPNHTITLTEDTTHINSMRFPITLVAAV